MGDFPIVKYYQEDIILVAHRIELFIEGNENVGRIVGAIEMKRPHKSVAFRLSIWFLLLSVLPLATMAIFMRRSVAEELHRVSAELYQRQAETNANFVSSLGNDMPLGDFMASSQPRDGTHFLVDNNGVYAAFPGEQPLPVDLRVEYSPETVAKVLGGESGYIEDKRAGKLVCFSPVPGRAWVDVISVNLSATDLVLDRLAQFSSFLLAVSLLVSSIAGGVAIWIVVGHPLRKLTNVAEQIGQGNLKVSVNPDEMEGELRVLASVLNQSAEKTASLINGLESRVQELNNAYSSMHASEERFRAIFDSSSDAIFVYDLETNTVLDATKKFVDLFGYTLEETAHLTLDDFSSGVAPYNQNGVQHWYRRMRRLGSQSFEWYSKDKSGRLFWVDVNMRAAAIDGKDRLLVTVRDIQERKHSDQMQTAVYRIFQIAQTSQTFFEFFGLAHEILADLLPMRNLSVAFYEPDTDLFTYPYHFNEYEAWPSIHASDDGLVTRVLRSGEPLLVPRESVSELNIPTFDDTEPKLQDWLGIPLRTLRGVFGVLIVKNYESAARLTGQDQENFAFISTQIAIAVERKRAEDALREAEARWRTLMETSPQLVMTIDRQGRVLFVNHTMPGLERDWLVVQQIFDFLPGENRSQRQEMLQRVFRERVASSFELSVPQPDGETFWFSCNLSPVVDQGRVDQAIFNATDITSLKRAESALRESEELYRRAIEAAGAVPYYRDHATNSFRFMGAGIIEMTGYSALDITTEKWDKLVRRAYLLGQAGGMSITEASKQARDGKLSIWQCDYEIGTRTGATRWIYDAAIELIGTDGKSYGSVGIMQDITARKLVEDALRQSESKFRSIVEQLSEGFVLIGEDGRVLELNRALEQMSGIKRQEIVGLKYWEAQTRILASNTPFSNQVKSLKDILEQALEEGVSPLFERPSEQAILNSQKEKIYVQQTAFPIRTEKGFRIGLLVRDVTEQKNADEKIRNMNDELERRVLERTSALEAANKELEAFSYSISHDLRAPLRAIDGFSRILSDEITSIVPPEVHRHLDVIRDNAQQMGRLIDDLLSFSRLSRQAIRKVSFSPLAMINQVLTTLFAAQEQRPVEIMIAPDLPSCQGDPTLIKQVWMNLLSNALKFTRDREHARIEIGAQKNVGEVIYFVKDNGAGFDMRYVGKLFGVFQRLHRSEDFEGTGVGLAIVQRIVRRHGGRIWAEGELGRGATFFFSLPEELLSDESNQDSH